MGSRSAATGITKALCGNAQFGFPKVSQPRLASIVSWARLAVIVSGLYRVELVIVVHAIANLSDFFQWRLARWAAQERSFVKLEFDSFGSRHGVNSTQQLDAIETALGIGFEVTSIGAAD